MGKVLVTGAAGYLGGHCLHAYLAAGHDALGLDRRIGAPGAPCRVGDLCDVGFMRRLLEETAPDLVVHCAGRMDDASPAELHRANIATLLGLMEAMTQTGAPALVLSSSCEVYGPAARAPVREDTLLAPTTAFAWSRMVAEEIIRDCAGRFGMRFAILRAFHLVGSEPGLNMIAAPPHRGAPHFSLFAALGAHPKPHVIAGLDHDTRDGSPEHDLVYVYDAARAHVAAGAFLLGGGESFIANLGRGRGVTEQELAAMVRRVSGVAPLVAHGQSHTQASGRYVADIHRARRLLNWRPQTGLERAIGSAFAHWQAHRALRREGELS